MDGVRMMTDEQRTAWMAQALDDIDAATASLGALVDANRPVTPVEAVLLKALTQTMRAVTLMHAVVLDGM